MDQGFSFAMRPQFFILILSLFLPSCAYTTEKSTQTVKIETPGANGATCAVNADGVLYRVNAPGNVFLTKNSADLIVDCSAPGNRRREVVVSPQVSQAFYWNAPLMPVAGAWDYASGAMFKYPDRIAVDFTGMDIKSAGLPAHNSPDIKQPEEYLREEYGASMPVLNADQSAEPVRLRLRSEASHDWEGEEQQAENNNFPNSSAVGYAPDKAAPGPVPLYPGG